MTTVKKIPSVTAKLAELDRPPPVLSASLVMRKLALDDCANAAEAETSNTKPVTCATRTIVLFIVFSPSSAKLKVKGRKRCLTQCTSAAGGSLAVCYSHGRRLHAAPPRSPRSGYQVWLCKCGAWYVRNMKSATVKAIIPADHRLVVQVPPELPAGPAEVVVRILDAAAEKGGTGNELLASGLFGICKDRTDIDDSVEFARRIRQQAERRHG